ncbi:hypothetical protein FACS1894219_06390 [Clostridia bacterium]|nr:hypothetical protein FACS1894219_06390 [Clostridia bacterium]
MEIRNLTKDDLLQDKKILAVAFEGTTDLVVEENPQNLDWEYGAFDEDNKLMGRMTVIPHEVYFDGQIVGSAGIGGVATLPEYRHKKSIRHIFEVAFEEMKKKKQYLSYLFPFSFAFYGKFGYETVCEQLDLKFTLAAFADIPRNNRCVIADDCKNPILRGIYEKYAARHNCAYNRNDSMWESKLSKNVYDKKYYTYLYYNEAGEPKGYFVWTPKGGRDFTIPEICFENLEDVAGMLGFIKNFEANYSRVVISNLPYNEDFSLMFTNQYDVERTLKFSGMARIADVAKTFELMKYPDGTGTFSVKTEDEFQPFNSGLYHIGYKDGKAVNVEHTQTQSGTASADLEVPVTALAKLILGTDVLSASRFIFDKRIKINGNCDTLAKVFTRKNIFVGDFF